MWRDDAYALDMLIAARKVAQFSGGVTMEKFCGDEVLQHAMMRLIQIIGEAARHVSDEYRHAHPEIPWAEIVGMRHRLVHEYFRIIPEKVFEVIQKDIPALIPALACVVPPDTPET